jgi:hypothetical protein
MFNFDSVISCGIYTLLCELAATSLGGKSGETLARLLHATSTGSIQHPRVKNYKNFLASLQNSRNLTLAN